jgi:hypothetical protein
MSRDAGTCGAQRVHGTSSTSSTAHHVAGNSSTAQQRGGKMFALPRRDNKLNARTETFGNDAGAWVETCQAGSRDPCANNGGLRYRGGRNCPASVCLGYK